MTTTESVTAPELTIEQIHAMTPELAKAELDRRTAAYTGANAPPSDPQKREPTHPTDADGIPIAPVPMMLSPAERAAKQQADAINSLEASGFPDRNSDTGKELWAWMDGREPVPPELEKQVENRLKSFQRDAEWCRQLMAGEQKTVAQFHTATAILAAAKIQRAARGEGP